MSFYARAASFLQSESAKTRSIVEIVTATRCSQLALIFVALAVGGQLEAQVDSPASEPGTGEQVETAPSPDLNPEAPVQIRPDEGSPVAGTDVSAPQFNIGRRLHLSGSLNGGYDDNVNLAPNGSPSWYVNPSANFSYQFGSARLAMDL